LLLELLIAGLPCVLVFLLLHLKDKRLCVFEYEAVQAAHELLSDLLELSRIVQNLGKQLLNDLHALQGLFVVHPGARLYGGDELHGLEFLSQHRVERAHFVEGLARLCEYFLLANLDLQNIVRCPYELFVVLDHLDFDLRGLCLVLEFLL
jgi:hypothetical protein